MKRISIHLPTSYRLDLHLVKKRQNLLSEPVIPNFVIIKNFKKGSKISRYFRHILEKTNIKKILGANIALMLVSSSLITPNIGAIETISDNVTTESPVVFKTTQSEIKFPTNFVKITQKYSFFHPGIDIDGITGDEIKPILNGVVFEIEKSRFGYGNAVLINHDGELQSLYAHLSKINVSVGQEVNTNTVIGLMGATGRAFGDHLHLEVYQSGKRINPLILLK